MSLFDTRNAPSRVFAEGGNLGSKPLKDRDALREAFVYHELSHMSKKDLKTFAKSKEAKYMLENEIISYNTLERLVNDEYGDRAKEFAVCHLAKENDDERWNALCRAREEERRLMNELLDEYSEEATRIADRYRQDYINPSIPKIYRVNDD